MSKLTDRLFTVLGIRTPDEFTKRSGAAAWVTYQTWHENWISQTDRRATAYYRRDGKVYKREFRERVGDTVADCRRKSIEAAQAYAAQRAGSVSEWVRSPWPDWWVPKDAYDRVMTDLKAAEAATKTARS